MKFLVYLAGPIAGLSYEESTDWRHWIRQNMPKSIKTLSPMRGTEHHKGETHVQQSYEDEPLCSRKGVTTRDRFDVKRCDLIIANFAGATKVSIGTCMEVAWADAYRKPLIAVMGPDNIHYHAMIRECAGYIVPTIGDAVDLAVDILLPDFL